MYLFFWEREGRRIMIITAWVILLALAVIGIVKITPVFLKMIPEKMEEQQLPETLLTPIKDLPLITYVEGSPEVKSEATDTWDIIETGDELSQGSVIRTDESSSLDIRMQPGTVVRVMENTFFSLNNYYQQKIELNVKKGTIVARVKRLISSQSFNFLTPAVVAGIRGTELIISSEPEGTTVFGMSGKIELFNPEFQNRKVIVGLLEKSFIKEGASPTEAVPMSRDEIDRYRKLLDSLRDNPVFIVSDNISFLPDSVQLTPEAYIAIESIYEQLLTVQGNIRVVGHTADIGSYESQIEISEGRAQAVVDYLVTLGMPASRLSAIGLGSKQPVSDDDARNRRVEFIIDNEIP